MSNASTPGGSVSRTKFGWTAGAGIEYAFLGNWSAKVEYLYADLGSSTCEYAACVIPADATVDFTANIVARWASTTASERHPRRFRAQSPGLSPGVFAWPAGAGRGRLRLARPAVMH